MLGLISANAITHLWNSLVKGCVSCKYNLNFFFEVTIILKFLEALFHGLLLDFILEIKII